MEQEIVDKFELTKKDCDKFISLIELIEECRNKSHGSFNDFMYIIVPMVTFRDHGFIIPNMKKLSDILGVNILKIVDKASLSEDMGNDFVLRKNGFNSELAKQKINLLKNIAPDDNVPQKEIIRERTKETVIKTVYRNPKNPRVTIFIDGNTISLNKSDKKMYLSGNRIEYLKKIVNSPNPLKKADLEPRAVKNFSTTIKRINTRIYNGLRLDTKRNIIINPHKAGYIISDDYEIKINPSY